MSDFEWWFLLAYTVFAVASILALMWVGQERPKASTDRAEMQGHYFGARK